MMAREARRKSETNLTLGVFVSLFGGYQDAIWSGIVEAAHENNAHVICFVGAALKDEVRSQKHWNAVYDLASPANLDGLIMISSALQKYTSLEELSRFYARYAPLPVISIAQELEGVPSITVDNAAGMCALMRHLIEAHGYRRIAFIQGPENNPEAQARYHVYTEALETHGIPFTPELVAPGDFTNSAGSEAIQLLLDRRKVDFEAVFASNDFMAIGAWGELAKRGFRVPADVAVAGFDDIREAQIYARPLTTVCQALPEQGRRAAQMLLEYIHTGEPPQNVVLNTELVIRESCGCLPSTIANQTISISAAPANTKNGLAQQRDVVAAEMRERICPHFQKITPDEVEAWVDAFFGALKGDVLSLFLPLLSHMLYKEALDLTYATLQSGVVSRWHDALSILREKALPYKHPDSIVDVEKLLFQSSILIAEVTEHIHLTWQAHIRATTRLQNDILRDISTASNTRQIADILAQCLPKLEINACFLALYEGEPVPPPQSRLIMAYHSGKRTGLEPDGQIFPSQQLIPPSVLSGEKLPSLMIRPLVMRDIHFGFIVMAMNAEHWALLANTFETFPEQIGLALYRVLLQNRIEQSNKKLERRADELAEANAHLEEANSQLEQFAYFASHDLQEPLRMVTSYLQLLRKRYSDRLDDDAHDFITYAIDGAIRMKQLISDLLIYSRVTTHNQPLELTNCEDLLARVLSDLKIAIEEGDALITHDPLPLVLADGAQLMGVFQNLISNAIKFRADRQPHIHISAEEGEDEWVFSVQDNGIGIEPEYFERIFVVFTRLHTQAKYPGTGIGLAICKKVVERHGGRIWIESQPGEGTTFFFTLPVYSSETRVTGS
jgi:signal transduction histidine kinase/DNA-binding LacI/PurR family transcriptional regulator